MREKIEEILIEISLKLAKEGKGCIFVIKEKDINYEAFIDQDIKPFSIFDDKNRKRLELLASHDGACIIDLNGNLIAYGTNIPNIRIFPGFGARHSAAYTASLSGNTVIISSEEDKKVKIFKEGKLVIQIDALTKGVEKKTSEIRELFEGIGAGAVGSTGIGILAPTLGITFIPGVIVFGSAYYLINKFLENKK